MKRAHSKTRWSLIGILLAAVILSYAGYWYLLRPEPQYPGIFAISTPLEYGDTIASGTLRKDAAAGEDGNYILVLDDGRPILLDVQGLDAILDLPVTVSGYLTPSVDGIAPAVMEVSSIEASSL